MLLAAVLALPALPAAPAAASPVGPDNFVIKDLGPYLWFYVPTCMAFLPDGRLLVGEKRGNVYLVKNSLKASLPIWNGQNEVLNSGDCGLMSIAVDPSYFANHYVYFLYTVDPDTNGVDSEMSGFGRLVRYQMSVLDTNAIDLSSRTVLLGTDWAHGPLTTSTHTVGSLRFGADGTLLVSIGEGAYPGSVDAGGLYPDAFGPGKTDTAEDIGAFRAQDLGSLCGKILRIDPATGHGLPDNPFYDGDPASVKSRVWAYGFRNPFRFCVRPGTGGRGHPGTLYIGDVGWLTWEEIDVASNPGRNYGWPCYEGSGENLGYQTAHPASHACSTMGLEPPELARMSWAHQDPTLSTPPGIVGNCAIGGAFYTGDRYPAKYRGMYFFSDYGGNWLRVASLDSLDHLTRVEDFANTLEGPTDFAVDPTTGDICYVSIAASTVRRVLYAGFPNQPPVAVASAVSPDSGAAPLTVMFSSAGSYDLEGSPLYYMWQFGDGSVTGIPNPAHMYATGGVYYAVLSVTDTLGGVGRDTVVVTATGPGAFPATPVLDDFDRANGPVGGAWTDNIAALVIADSALTQSGPPSPWGVWGGQVFGVGQEVHVKLRTIAPACRRYSLLLKVQGTSFSNGGIEVRYDATLHTVEVSANQPSTGWKVKGTLSSVTFADGDVFGARVYDTGVLQVFRNREKLGEFTLDGFAFNTSGGRIGLDLAGASGARLDDFGGGSVFTGINTPPHAVIAGPAPGAFFAEGDTVWLRSGSTDDEESTSLLSYQWQVDLHHNNHVHPAIYSCPEPGGFFVMHNHDDGTGVSYAIKLYINDTGGLRDTAEIQVFPQIDLMPSAIVTTPDPPAVGSPTLYRFAIRNLGGIAAPRSRWTLCCDGIALAQGDTAVGARDSVVLGISIPPQLSVGVHTLRLVADTLGQIVEVSEANNAVVRQLTIVSGPMPDTTPPSFVRNPSAEPLSGFAWVRWATNEPTVGVVHYGPSLAMLDSVVVPAPADTGHAVMLPSLRPHARYFYAVTAVDLSGNMATAPTDSFLTSGSVDQIPLVPGALELSSPMPNPSRGAVDFGLALPAAARVQLRVFDLLGREIWRGADTELPAGRWRIQWPGTGVDGRPARAGVYLARVQVGDRALLKRIAVLR